MNNRIPHYELVNRLHEATHGRLLILVPSSIQSTLSIVVCQCVVCGYVFQCKYEQLTRCGTGCAKCNRKYRMTLQEIHQALHDTSAGRYSYEIKPPVTSKKKTRVLCKCNTCQHKWGSSVDTLLSLRSGCPKCAGHLQFSDEDAISRLDGVCAGRYSFHLDGEYKNVRTRVYCKCNTCGYQWYSTFATLYYKGSGCIMCHRMSISTKKTLSISHAEATLTKVADGRYTFNLSGYKNTYSKVECTCLKCGRIWRCVYNTLVTKKRGCPSLCYITPIKVSSSEHEITGYIKQNFPQLEILQSVRNLIKNPKGTHAMEVDIYIPELRLAFEFNGNSDKVVKKYKKGFTSAQQYHDYKTEQCAQKGVKLVHIDEAEYVADKQKVLDNIVWEAKNANL